MRLAPPCLRIQLRNFEREVRKLLRTLLAFAWLTLAFCSATFAQYTTASLGGTVVDESGAAIPSAVVTVKSPTTGFTQKVEGLTYASQTPQQREENRRSWNIADVVGSAVVLGMVLGVYLYFSFWLS